MSGLGALRRIAAVLLRHWYLIAGSWPRFLDLCYWPIVQMILWGFIQTFMMRQSSFFAQAGGILLGAVMLWDVLFRGQIGLAISFFEEIYSRNLGHLMATPLKIGEYMAALMIVSLMRTAIGLFPATLLAIWFFGFSLYSLGFALVAFFAVLIGFGWSIGLFVSGLVLRYGLGAESYLRIGAALRSLLSNDHPARLGAIFERIAARVLYFQRYAIRPDAACCSGR
jgi:ABC-2 type transport system permease protein